VRSGGTTQQLCRGLVAFALLAGAMLLDSIPAAEASGGIAFRAASSKGTKLAKTITITKPSGVQSGDVLIAGLYVREQPTITPPSGWTLIRQDGKAYSYVHVAGPAEPASYKWTFPAVHTAAGGIVAYSGVSNVTPVQATSGKVNGKSKSITAPSVTTTQPGSMVVGLFGVNQKTTIAPPSGMTERVDVASTNDVTNATTELAELLVANPSATGGKVATAGIAGGNSGQLIALNPAPTQSDDFTAQALNSYSALLQWTAVPGAASYQIFRDGRLIDDIGVGPTTYTDFLLWQSTAYGYELEAFDAGGQVIADLVASVTTPAQVGSFPKLYADTSFWNQPIGSSPLIDPNSAAIVASSITPYDGVATFNNDDDWGIPLAYGDPASKMYSVGCLLYGCNVEVLFRIPRYAQANHGSDGKLVVLDPSIDTELDMGRATYDPDADSWTTGSRYKTPSNGWGAMCDQGQHCDGVLMSGIDQFGGVVRPEEIAQGHIDHALALVVGYWRSGYFACPAVKSGGGVNDANAIPLGARIQLDPTFDVDAQTWPQWQKVVAKALQTYGAVATDAGSTGVEIRGEANLNRGYDAWAKVGMGTDPGSTSLAAFPWEKMRVLKITQC
jgi:hypothetical protein